MQRSTNGYSRWRWGWVLAGCLAAGVLVGMPGATRAAGALIQNGDKLAFLGDSITAQGNSATLGYVRLVAKGLEANDIRVVPIPAGISGHKSNDMLARLQKDVLEKKPNWMTLSCGVNDVWHGPRGVPLPQYKSNITAIVSQAQAAGVKVMILTSTLIKEDVTNEFNRTEEAYNAFLRTLAVEKHCPLADLNADMRAALPGAAPDPALGGNRLTVDGVHMNVWGNQMMALGILRAFGLTDAQLSRARTAWDEIPNAMQVGITLRQYRELAKIAQTQHRSVDAVVNEAVSATVSNLLKSAK